MQKEKLRQARLQKGYTQQQLADFIHTDISNYCRKENGSVSITKDEWKKLSGFLEVREEDIFEESDNLSTYSNIPDSIVKNLQDFIVLLQEENKRLKKRVEFLSRNNKL